VSEQLVLLKDPPSEVLQLRDGLRAEWPAITRAQSSASDAVERLRSGLEGYVPPETSFVVFGSLGRRELTTGSDIDWTLLVDGAADPAHRDAEIRLGKAGCASWGSRSRMRWAASVGSPSATT
jgi:glutamine synthetase adenylyltransferase